jgi:hypothetical protein
MPDGQITHCRDCGRDIVWARTNSGKPMPLEVPAAPDGNVAALVPAQQRVGDDMALGLGTLAVVLAGDVLDEARDRGVRLYLSHFATCPAASTRKRR